MEKTTQDFKNLHKERQELIDQWESTLKSTNFKDLEIVSNQNHLLELKVKFFLKKEQTRNLLEVLSERKNILTQQTESNETLEKKIELDDRSLGKIR